MTWLGRFLCIVYVIYLSRSNHGEQTCFQQSNHLNYLFLNENSQIKIPLLPFDCHLCQSAYHVDIQLMDEQIHFNRTIQRLKIFLKNFEIEDLSYICLDSICPILVEHGSDSIIVNLTSSSLFSHALLSFNYFNHSEICSIQTRFLLFSSNQSFTCTSKIALHPRFNPTIVGQFRFLHCRTSSFNELIFQNNLQFQQLYFHTHHLQTTIKSSGNSCESILEISNYFFNSSSLPSKELFSLLTIFSYSNPWNEDIRNLGPCRTEIVPYREMIFTNDVIHLRKIFIERGQTIDVQCPIDGSEEYLKYTWYYQRYQPKYQISTHRTISLQNITEQMQGQYMCLADDGYETLEFEMMLHISSKSKSNIIISKYWIVASILLLSLLLVYFLIIFIIYIFLKKSSPTHPSINKPNALTIHHDVMLTIQRLPSQRPNTILSIEDLYPALEYIDDQTTSTLPQWIRIKEIPHRYSTRHRNVNRQFSMNIPLVRSHSDMTLSSNRQIPTISDEKSSEMKMLKISVPIFNNYSRMYSSYSNMSFDSQRELDEFHQMTNLSLDLFPNQSNSFCAWKFHSK